MPSTERRVPKALLVTTVDWAATTRLALALAESGMQVGAATPIEHEIRRLNAISPHFPCAPSPATAAAIAAAIQSWSPEILLPCDDRALSCLHALYARAREGLGHDPVGLVRLIERSLGASGSHEIARRKSAFIAFAARAHIAVPETVVLRDRADLARRLAAARFPQVLKADGSWGGIGVRIVANAEAAERAYGELVALPSWPSQATLAVKGLSVQPLRARFRGAILRDQVGKLAPTISMQRFIEGSPANRAVACWKGEVLAGLSVEALETRNETGPATVARIIRHPEMEMAALRLVRLLGLSGLCGFDFILERATGRALLIEMNARATPICSFTLSYESDLIGAFTARLRGVPRRPVPRRVERAVIVLEAPGSRRPAIGAYRRAFPPAGRWQPEAAVASGGVARRIYARP